MNKQTFQKHAIRHGELFIKPIDQIPESATEIFSGKEYTIGHSESGHHHEAVADLRVMTDSNNRMFIDVRSDGWVKHLKTGPHQHKSMELFKGFYEVIAKFTYNPFKKLREKVRD